MNKMLVSNKGAMLAIVTMALFSLGMLGVTMCLRGVNESRSARRQLYSAQSFWLAEAGIQKAVWEIKNNACRGLRNQITNVSCTSCTCGTGNMVVSGLLGSGEYEAVVNSQGTSISSRGYYPSRAAVTVQRGVQVTLAGTPIFGYAAFAQGKMTFTNNSLVDSYNSANGDYGGANISSNGNIGTNSTALGAIDLSNNVIIKGSASTGVGGTVTGNGTVTGQITHANNVTIAPVVVPSDLAGSTDLGTLSFSNNETKTLTSGNYKYDHITFNNNVILTISGDVKMYLTGASGLQSGNNAQIRINADSTLVIYSEGVIALGNNVVLNNLSKKPSNFIIYSKYTGSNGVVISNNGTFYGAVHAKDTDIDLENNAEIYGAMVGKTIDVSNNAEVHFDLALSSLIASGSLVPADWQEI